MDYGSVFATVVGMYAKLADAIDNADPDSYVRLFTDDCFVESPNGDQVVGRDALLTARRSQSPRARARHYVTNHVVEVSDDGSEIQAKAVALAVDLEHKTVTATTIWQSTITISEGHALISRHVTQFDRG